MPTSSSESEKFDAVVRRLLSVSHEEIQKRETRNYFAPSMVSPTGRSDAITTFTTSNTIAVA